MPANSPFTAVIQDGDRWLHFSDPVRVVTAATASEVRPALRRVVRAVEGEGLHAAGYIAYEAAPGFDPALAVRGPAPLPLLWFGLYRAPAAGERLPAGGPYTLGDWRPSQEIGDYRQTIARIKAAIARGDSYQVNYTMALHATWQGDPWGLFVDLTSSQRGGYAAYLDLATHAICSASPELFVEIDGDLVRCKPMKGTAPRGRTLAEDRQQIAALRASAKDQAENVMIVDMIRNDLGRIARFGSVHAPSLLEVERYPTLLQMTSTVEARSDEPLDAILAALFPCASITGAPKVRTMQLIADLEGGPRGVYTGAIGYLAPGRRARFNVAIRTVVVDRAEGQASYGVGSGIVWDSDADAEYAECQLKTQVLTRRIPDFELLETMRWTADGGVARLERHLARLAGSAEYFGFAVNLPALRSRLMALAPAETPHPARVRVLVSRRGEVRLETHPLELSAAPPPVRLGLARTAVDSGDLFLFHKTTHRRVYEEARAGRPDCDDVLLWNERGELTEATTANVVLALDGRLVTPPVACGLLAGVLRADLLERGAVEEERLTVDDLARCQGLYLVNSLRGWRRAHLAPAPDG
jgi:para-aminobenzoate synthetase/4-amino-4-deoxychorismate lyase